MELPTRFKLFGQTISVMFSPERFTDSDGLYGFSCYRKNEIQLRPSTETLPFTHEQIMQTFWHELTHFILFYAGAAYGGKTDYMHQDEGFIDIVGSLLHQAVESFEFE